jgi:site-specific recombinase XerD
MDKTNFTKYLESKELKVITINSYIKNIERFFAKVKKEDLQVTKPDVLKFLEYLKNGKRLQNHTRYHYLIALNYYFMFLYENERIATNPCLFIKIRGLKRKKLHKIYTPEELDQLYDNYYQLFVQNYDDSRHRHEEQKQYSVLYRWRNALIVSILFNQGTSTSEIEKIEMGDYDLIKAIIRIRGGNRRNDRTLPLKATQIGLFMHYLQNIRPQLTNYQTKESEKLFLPLPAISYKKTDNDMNRGVFKPITDQIKSIDKQFKNFHQIRASVISFWIKTHGLRKAQHLAGHRLIFTTEKYITNNLDNLIEDINKLHPF